jgi:DNA-binding SARP family transcriptional activator
MDQSQDLPKIHLRLLGSFAVSRDSEDVTAALSQPKRLALVTWLALTRPRGSHRRDSLCALLWPESTDERARGALRQLLVVLRRELGDRAFAIEGDLIAINQDVVSSDVGAVLDALEAGDDAKAVDLYTGELLPGLHLPEGEAFGRWFDERRSELRRCVTRAAWRLVDRAEALGNVAEARSRAERALVIDPDDEAGLRRVMTLQSQAGDRAAALRTHETFARHLGEDWATKPDAETEALVDQIRAATVYGGPKPGVTAPIDPPIAAVASVETKAVSVTEFSRGLGRRSHRLRWLFVGAITVVGVAIVALARRPRTTRPIKADRVLVELPIRRFEITLPLEPRLCSFRQTASGSASWLAED